MEIVIPEEPIEKAYTISEYSTNKPQSIIIKYVDSSITSELWSAIPNCEHEIQAQRSGGIICRKCGGWHAF